MTALMLVVRVPFRDVSHIDVSVPFLQQVGGTEYPILRLEMAKSTIPPFALLYLLFDQSDGPSTPQHWKCFWISSIIMVRDSITLYSSLIAFLKLDFMNASSLSLFWYDQTPAAISAVRTISMQQKNWINWFIRILTFLVNSQRLTETNMHCDSLKAPQHPQKAKRIINTPIARRMKRAYWKFWCSWAREIANFGSTNIHTANPTIAIPAICKKKKYI